MEIPENQPTESVASEADLLTLAMQADEGKIKADDPIEVKPSSPSPETEGKTADDKSAKEQETNPEKGPETKEADEQKAKEEADKEGKTDLNESKYSKAKREEERREKSWQKLEAEKAALKAEREAYEREKAGIQLEKAKAKEYRDSAGYTAKDYEDFAKRTDDPDLAERAMEKAKALALEADQVRSKAQHEDFIKGWQGNLEEIFKQEPELRDASSEAGKALQKVLNENPVFSTSPDGIKAAYAFSKAQRQASLVSGLTDKVSELQKENERLNKLTGLSGNGPNKRPSIKSFEEMSGAEQEAQLLRMAAEADGGAY